MAGTGKSTISRTVARTCADQKRLGASFFFSRGRGDLSHAGKLMTSLAAQLANTIPPLKYYVYRAIVENPDITQRGIDEQWKYLIYQPLANLKEVSLQSELFVLVIDALDECEGDNDTRLILRLLADAKTLDTIRLRVFITSRPETPIRFGFCAIPEAAHQDFVLHDISQSIVQNDISVFFKHELENIRTANSISEGWPSDSQIDLLCQRANGLFIYASTACRFIQDPSWSPDEGLSFILEDDYRELDDMYTGILERSNAHGDRYRRYREKLHGQPRQIIGSIVILFDPLPAARLAELLDIEMGTVRARLRCLHSVLDVPNSEQSPIRLLHPSFRDFLLDHQRCKDPEFWIDEPKAHNHLFVSCLQLMSQHLKTDMCNLQLPGTLVRNIGNGVVEKCVPLDVQYACRYWVYHLQRSNIELENTELGNRELHSNDHVHKFLQTHFLHWLEALSLRGKISEGILALEILESITVSSNIT
jgi:hypothetical protein